MDRSDESDESDEDTSSSSGADSIDESVWEMQEAVNAGDWGQWEIDMMRSPADSLDEDMTTCPSSPPSSTGSADTVLYKHLEVLMREEEEAREKKRKFIMWRCVQWNTQERRNRVLEKVLATWLKSVIKLGPPGGERVVYEIVSAALEDYKHTARALPQQHSASEEEIRSAIVSLGEIPYPCLDLFFEMALRSD
mmetsp:Transcript_41830/g.90267  ORF Transcript_41830/g.90267 Transcript_41830/m.90267 type:complete len:194 (-) Transcript_41830:250-831(-)